MINRHRGLRLSVVVAAMLLLVAMGQPALGDPAPPTTPNASKPTYSSSENGTSRPAQVGSVVAQGQPGPSDTCVFTKPFGVGALIPRGHAPSEIQLVVDRDCRAVISAIKENTSTQASGPPADGTTGPTPPGSSVSAQA